MKLPKKIRILYRDYRLEKMLISDVASLQRFGDCNCNVGVIRYDDTWAKEKIYNTLIHEILHALWYEMNCAEGAKEEDIVKSLAVGLSTVMRDNKKLFMDMIKARQ